MCGPYRQDLDLSVILFLILQSTYTTLRCCHRQWGWTIYILTAVVHKGNNYQSHNKLWCDYGNTVYAAESTCTKFVRERKMYSYAKSTYWLLCKIVIAYKQWHQLREKTLTLHLVRMGILWGLRVIPREEEILISVSSIYCLYIGVSFVDVIHLWSRNHVLI